MQEVTVSLAAAKERSVDAAVAAVLSEQAGIFYIKKRMKNSTEGFSWWKRCLVFLLYT